MNKKGMFNITILILILWMCFVITIVSIIIFNDEDDNDEDEKVKCESKFTPNFSFEEEIEAKYPGHPDGFGNIIYVLERNEEERE